MFVTYTWSPGQYKQQVTPSFRGALCTYHLVASKIPDLALEFPHIDRLAANVGNGDSAATLLTMEEVELLQKVETGARGRLERVELLQPGFKPERLARLSEKAVNSVREPG